jgi:hypothetical protein
LVVVLQQAADLARTGLVDLGGARLGLDSAVRPSWLPTLPHNPYRLSKLVVLLVDHDQLRIPIERLGGRALAEVLDNPISG